MSNNKFPPRVTECFSMGGLRVDYFSHDSSSYEATQEVDRGREYLSLAEHQEALRQARASAFEEARYRINSYKHSIPEQVREDICEQLMKAKAQAIRQGKEMGDKC